MEIGTIMAALGLTLVAGLSTGVGSLLAFFAKASNTRFLSCALGLSAGVMVYVSFMDLLPDSIETLCGLYAGKTAQIYALIAFFVGIGVIALIDFLIPEDENPHEMHSYDELKDNPDYQAWLSDESGEFVIPGGESNRAVRERAVGCVRRLAAAEDGAMLAVCHGGIIAAVMHEFFRDSSRSFYNWIPHACHGYAICFRNGQPSEWKAI